VKTETPAVRMGKPGSDSQTLFVPIKIREITIWKSVNVEVDENKDSIKIGLSQFFFFKHLSIDGAKVLNTCEV
jgi:hypothetical protein